MNNYQIFSDGSCDMDAQTKKQFEIQTVPFYVSLDGQSYYKEIEEITLDEFYGKLTQDVSRQLTPKTSLPSSMDYMNAFAPYLEKEMDILCFCLSYTLSGSYQSAVNAKEMLHEKFPDRKIIIIDSTLATGSQALLLKESAKMKKNGFSIEENAKRCEVLKESGRIIFMVGDLYYLQLGGRIGKLSFLAGSLLKIIPLIKLKNSEISSVGTSRNQKKALRKIIELLNQHMDKHQLNANQLEFCIGYTTNKDNGMELQMLLKEIIGYEPDLIQIGATIGTHTGPNTNGICFIQKWDA